MTKFHIRIIVYRTIYSYMWSSITAQQHDSLLLCRSDELDLDDISITKCCSVCFT